MKMRRVVLPGLVFSGLLAGAGIAMAGEGEAAERLKAQRDQVVKLAVPIFERIDAYNKLKDQQVDLDIDCRRALTDAEQAKKTLEVEQIAIKEYEEGTYPTEVQAAKGEIALAESDLVKARDRKEWSEKMLRAGGISKLENQSARLALDKAEYGVESAKRKLKVLTDFSRIKQVTELKANVIKAEADVNEKQQRYDQLKSQREELGREVANDPAPNRSEMKILLQVQQAITLLDDNQPDEAQKKLDDAEQTARELEAVRAERRFLATKDRIKNLFDKTMRGGFRGFPGRLPKPE